MCQLMPLLPQNPAAAHAVPSLCVHPPRCTTGMYVDSVVAFRAVRRRLPPNSVFNLQYEDWLDEGRRLSVLGRLVDFIGKLCGCVCDWVCADARLLTFHVIADRYIV